MSEQRLLNSHEPVAIELQTCSSKVFTVISELQTPLVNQTYFWNLHCYKWVADPIETRFL